MKNEAVLKMASATLLNATGNSLSGEGLSANGLIGGVISGGSLHSGASLSGSSLPCNGLSSDSCSSNNLSINHSGSNLVESRLDHRPTRSKLTLPDINNNGNSSGSNMSGTMSQSDLVSANPANVTSLNASNLSSSRNSNGSSSSNTSSGQSSNLNSSNPNQTTSLNDQINGSYSNQSTEMLKTKHSSACGSIENSPQDYLSHRKSNDNSKSAFSSSLYSEVAMDVKVISQDCVIYNYCSDVNRAIEDHFKRALNTNIYSNSNDKHKGKPLNQPDTDLVTVTSLYRWKRTLR